MSHNSLLIPPLHTCRHLHFYFPLATCSTGRTIVKGAKGVIKNKNLHLYKE